MTFGSGLSGLFLSLARSEAAVSGISYSISLTVGSFWVAMRILRGSSDLYQSAIISFLKK